MVNSNMDVVIFKQWEEKSLKMTKVIIGSYQCVALGCQQIVQSTAPNDQRIQIFEFGRVFQKYVILNEVQTGTSCGLHIIPTETRNCCTE